jgi:hypothetical protein
MSTAAACISRKLNLPCNSANVWLVYRVWQCWHSLCFGKYVKVSIGENPIMSTGSSFIRLLPFVHTQRHFCEWCEETTNLALFSCMLQLHLKAAHTGTKIPVLALTWDLNIQWNWWETISTLLDSWFRWTIRLIWQCCIRKGKQKLNCSLT